MSDNPADLAPEAASEAVPVEESPPRRALGEWFIAAALLAMGITVLIDGLGPRAGSRDKHAAVSAEKADAASPKTRGIR